MHLVRQAYRFGLSTSATTSSGTPKESEALHRLVIHHTASNGHKCCRPLLERQNNKIPRGWHSKTDKQGRLHRRCFAHRRSPQQRAEKKRNPTYLSELTRDPRCCSRGLVVLPPCYRCCNSTFFQGSIQYRDGGCVVVLRVVNVLLPQMLGKFAFLKKSKENISMRTVLRANATPDGKSHRTREEGATRQIKETLRAIPNTGAGYKCSTAGKTGACLHEVTYCLQPQVSRLALLGIGSGLHLSLDHDLQFLLLLAVQKQRKDARTGFRARAKRFDGEISKDWSRRVRKWRQRRPYFLHYSKGSLTGVIFTNLGLYLVRGAPRPGDARPILRH